MPVRREYVADLYRNLLGRGDNYTDAEVDGWVNAPDEQSVYNMFISSPEYTSKHGGTAGWQDVGGVITPTQDPTSGTQERTDTGDGGSGRVEVDDSGTGSGTGSGSGTTTSGTGTPPGSLASFLDLSAFNMGRAQDPNKSAKDSYADLASKAPPPPLHDRAAMKAWFEQHIAPGMNARNHRIIRVDDNGFEYENHEGRFYVDYAENLGAAPGTMRSRIHWNATPSDDATRARYAGSGRGGSSVGGGAGASAMQRTTDGISRLYSQLGQTYAPPGGPGVANGPVQQVGQDPLSQLITGGLADLILGQGATRDGQDLMASLKSIIDSGGYLPNDNARNKRFESARELMAKGERTALNDARAALANRGLLSEPGSPSGAERSTIGRVQTRNAEEFARALRDIGIAEDDAANTRLTHALSLATGMADSQARTMLATLGEGSNRQQMLAQVALENLQTNMAWNQFLAQFGLERDKVMYQLQNGQVDSLMPMIALFLQLAQSTQRGYI